MTKNITEQINLFSDCNFLTNINNELIWKIILLIFLTIFSVLGANLFISSIVMDNIDA